MSTEESNRNKHKQTQYKFNTLLSQPAANKPLFHDKKEQFPSVSRKKCG